MTLTAAPDTRPAPVEPTTPIKPSEAIRLGCLTTLPRSGALLSRDEEGRFSACALGAMAVGYGFRPGRDDGRNLMSFLADKTATGPVPIGGWPTICHLCGFGPGNMVIHLNDTHERRWSRERIADWLEGLGL